MSIIKIPIRFEGENGDATILSLFDSGANLSCINEEYAKQIAHLSKFKTPRRLATASAGHFIEVNYIIRTDFYINEVQLSDEFLVVPGMSEDAIIGAATMQKWRMKLDFEHDTVTVDPKVAKLQLI